jgi:hypothetical protein
LIEMTDGVNDSKHASEKPEDAKQVSHTQVLVIRRSVDDAVGYSTMVRSVIWIPSLVACKSENWRVHN